MNPIHIGPEMMIQCFANEWKQGVNEKFCQISVEMNRLWLRYTTVQK